MTAGVAWAQHSSKDTHMATHTHAHTQGMCCHTTGAILTSQHTCLPGWHFILSREIEIIRYLLNFSFSFFSEAGQKDESGTACCLVRVCMCLVCVCASAVWANSYSGSRESETAKWRPKMSRELVFKSGTHTHTHVKRCHPLVPVFQMLHGQKIVPVWAADTRSLRRLFA